MRKQKQEEYKGYRTAGIRLMEPMLAGLPAFSEGQDEGALYPYHLFDKAHLVMLAEEALIPKTDVALMLKELRSTEPDKIVESRMEAGGAMHSGRVPSDKAAGGGGGGKDAPGPELGGPACGVAAVSAAGRAAHADGGDQRASGCVPTGSE